jgi:hypothetical protein
MNLMTAWVTQRGPISKEREAETERERCREGEAERQRWRETERKRQREREREREGRKKEREQTAYPSARDGSKSSAQTALLCTKMPLPPLLCDGATAAPSSGTCKDEGR